MIYVWLAVVLAAILTEAATVDLVAIWFMPAAIVAMVLAVFDVPLWIQIVVFIALTALFLLISKRFLRRYLKRRPTEITNSDALIGQTAIVTETIDNRAQSGAVRVAGLEWSARATDDDMIIEKDSLVTIHSISGVKLICERKQ